MARDFYINGESMVYVKGRSSGPLATLQELGLSVGPIRVVENIYHEPLNVDAWGRGTADVQTMLADATISMTLVHFDPTILRACIAESKAGAFTGSPGRAGIRLGGGGARFGATNFLIGLNIASPQAGLPWRFYFCYLSGPPYEWPLATQRSQVSVNWRAIPYTQDPWGAGTGAASSLIYDNTLDT